MPLHSRTLGDQVAQVGDVRERALEIRLQHDPHVLEALAAERPVERERVVDAGRVLHVDSHEHTACARVADERLEQGTAQVEVDLQAEPGQLDRDVGVEPVGVDRGEHVGVCRRDRPRFLLAVYLLAEDVDRRALAAAVQRDDGAVGRRRASGRRCREPKRDARAIVGRREARWLRRGRRDPR